MLEKGNALEQKSSVISTQRLHSIVLLRLSMPIKMLKITPYFCLPEEATELWACNLLRASKAPLIEVSRWR